MEVNSDQPSLATLLATFYGGGGVVVYADCGPTNLDFDDPGLEVVQHHDDVIRVCRGVCTLMAGK